MCELQRKNINSSNRASDSRLLSALNTLPAIENNLSTGAEDAGIAR